MAVMLVRQHDCEINVLPFISSCMSMSAVQPAIPTTRSDARPLLEVCWGCKFTCR